MKDQNKTTTTQARERRVESIPTKELKPASWNTHSKSKRGDADFEGLIQSLRSVGLLQRPTVRAKEDGGYEIVDGHRRIEAARAMHMKTVECDVWYGLGDAEAQVMTATANLQRIENDPLLEAELIEKMRKDGKTFAWIAAQLGKTESYVTRRARLTSLTPTWREVFARCEDASVALMEFVAAHEAGLQNKVACEMQLGDFGKEPDDDGEEAEWQGDDEYELNPDEVKRLFERGKMAISDAVPFDRTQCAKCPCNTACHGLLFPAEEDEEVEGRCQSAGCYRTKWNEAVDAKIKTLREKGLKPLEARDRYSIPNCYNLAERQDASHPQPWVYTDYEGLKRIEWAMAAEKKEAKPALTKAEKEALRTKRRLHAEWNALRRDAFAKMRSKFVRFDPGKERDTTEVRKAVEAVSRTDRFITAAVEHVVGLMTDYTGDSNCWSIWHSIGADGFKGLGVELTPEEVEAVESEDPLNK